MIVLPNGWQWAQLGDLAAPAQIAITDGPFGSNLKTEHYTESGPRVIRLQNVGDGVFNDADKAHISVDHYDRLKKHEALAGDVVIAALGDVLPRACIVPEGIGAAIVKADCIRVRLGAAADPRFIMWMLNAPPSREAAASLISGVGRPRLNLAKIRSLRVPLPPIVEQRRIVEVVEEEFSRLAAAEASLARTLRNLKRLRAASIAAALVGNWPEVEFASIIKSLRNGIFASRPAKNPPGIPIFRISAVRPMQLDVEDVRYALLPAEEAEGYFVEPGDLLFTRYSGNPSFVGASAVVPRLVTPTLHPDKLIRVVVDHAKVRSEFVSLTLNNGIARKQIESRLKTTAGQVGISGSQLRSVVLRLPPLATQQDIVEDISRKLSAYDAEMKGIDIALRRSHQLRRAILETAFAGRLIPQDRSAGIAPAGAILDASVDATRRFRRNETEVIGKAEVSV